VRPTERSGDAALDLVNQSMTSKRCRAALATALQIKLALLASSLLSGQHVFSDEFNPHNALENLYGHPVDRR
jgi:hypothetical protein